MLLSWSLLLFVFAVVVIFCGRLFCEEKEPTVEAPSPPPAAPQNRTTAPVEAAPEVFPRTSLGRILKPVNDEEAQFSSQSPSFTDETDSARLPSENLASSQNRNSSRAILSADFGDNEIFSVEETACTICLVDFEHGEEIQRNAVYDISGGTTCDHIFHPHCISSWIQKSDKKECPCCRRLFQIDSVTKRTLTNPAEC